MDATKRCRSCGEIKPTSEFHKHRGHADGLNGQCKSCRNRSLREDREAPWWAYQRIGRSGTLEERFLERTCPEPTSGCWLWMANIDVSGNGLMSVGGKAKRGADVSWSIYRGNVPHGMSAKSRCGNIYCVNPSHLHLLPKGAVAERFSGRKAPPRKARLPKICPECGIEFRAAGWMKPNEWERKVWCSVACASVARSVPVADRLRNNSALDPETGCVNFTGHRNDKGYGYLAATEFGKQTMTAHRASYIVSYGQIPDGLHVLHRCDNPSCINPEHLFLGTNDDNVADRVSKRRSRGAAGERNCKAKLTEKQVLAIRGDHRPGTVVAKDYGVTQPIISAIRLGKIWRHV